MSNPHAPQNPGQPQHPGPQQSGSQPAGPQQWAPQSGPNQGGANGTGPGSLTSGSFPAAGSAQGYPGAQPGYPGEHPRQQGYVGGPYGQKQAKQKKPLLKRWWFWLLVIVVVIAMFSALGGGGEDTTDDAGASSAQDEKAAGAQQKEEEAPAEEGGDDTDAAAAEYGIGDAVAADGWEITVNKVEDGVASVGDEFMGAEAQGQFVTVALSVKNTESEPDYFFEDNIKLGDESGNTYSADSEAGIYVDENSILFLEEINPGNTAEGVLVFDVPEDINPDRLSFEGGIFSDPIEISLK
ncbi:DUF4352 domain-containing protein [Brevibacterium aurantiacum]|uniref:DUF4352 domain-containing protein n=1 Tax=Brevibacterium aurantiacum TaxID=273384 RepID=A0A2A3ZNH4_BREAU|nr:DUF4352 domain-containing protein [Brevibacterium aurantiacum]PCC53159.1 hypothetical protein CIK59_13610 [Brevibacterium aurantiacum]